MIISLTGFMGCGKSSIGKKLAALLSCPYADTDKFIEEKEGTDVSGIFTSKGESYFRKKEKTALESLIKKFENQEIAVLSVGGGTLTQAECRKMITEDTVCFYIQANPSKLTSNLEHTYRKRPLLADIDDTDKASWREKMTERISGMLAEREPYYISAARYILYTDKNCPEQTAHDIIRILRLREQRTI